MNYILHNYTENYSNPDKTNFREILLGSLKNYGLFQHLRDTCVGDLDIYNVDDWLIPLKGYEDDIKDLKIKIKDVEKELQYLDEEKIKSEWQKEVNRLEWYNNPESNYYTRRVENISNVINKFEPQIKKFKELCGISWINDVVIDVLDCARVDLNEAQRNEEKEIEKREYQPHKIPTFEEYRLNYIKDKEEWSNHFKQRLLEKKKALKRCKENNKLIKEIFDILNKIDCMED